MSLMDAPAYDPARERRKKILIISAIVAVLLLAFLAFWFRYWPYEHAVDRFFDALEAQDYKAAYGVWMADPEWEQHPEQHSQYPYNEFYEDWGPGGEWGVVNSHRIEQTIGTGGSGVVVVVEVNHRVGDKARIWVEKETKTLGFSPI